MVVYAIRLQLMVLKNNNINDFLWFFIQVHYFKPF
jgi:hypothetical protein